jgi:uncharacterized DUF497 family protein
VRFEWDPTKAARNHAKHGVAFEEAATAFADPRSMTAFDRNHSGSEDRYVLLGATHAARLLVVAYTRREESVRIISARIASRRERRSYAGG